MKLTLYRVKVIEDMNLFHDPIFEGTYIVNVLAPFLITSLIKINKIGLFHVEKLASRHVHKMLIPIKKMMNADNQEKRLIQSLV